MTAETSQRIDRWLWHARIFKTRSLAAKFVSAGKVRINGSRVSKASHTVSAGDVLTFVLHENLKVLSIAGLADRRGPYSEAQHLYADESPPPLPKTGEGRERSGGPRPTKQDRRRRDRFTGKDQPSE